MARSEGREKSDLENVPAHIEIPATFISGGIMSLAAVLCACFRFDEGDPLCRRENWNDF
jgi:hypothetical protein